MAAKAGSLHHVSNALHAESLACLKRLQLASSLDMQNVLLETDAQILASALTSTSYDRSELGMIFREIKTRMNFDFLCCKISKCSRDCNSIADVLASYGAALGHSQCRLYHRV